MNIRGITMNLMSPELQKEFEREKKLMGDYMSDENIVIKPLDVLKAHYIITDYFADEDDGRVLFGVKNMDLLFSAVGRQATSFGGKEKWSIPLEKCASLFYGLNKNHAFNDGNKRTSLLITLYNLHLIHRTPIGNQREFETLAVKIASSELKYYKSYQKSYQKYKNDLDAEIYTIAHELKKLTRQTDKRFYALTYREFAQKLKQYDNEYYFGSPKGGYISIYKKRKGLSGLLRKNDIFIKQIGFPGWNRQMGKKAAMSILHDIGLDDYAQFFKGGEPIYQLLDRYSAPLSRLKDA